MNPLLIILTGASIIGAIRAAQGRALEANIIWAITNPLLVWHNLTAGEYEQAGLFFIFTALAVYGVYNLGGMDPARILRGSFAHDVNRGVHRYLYFLFQL